MCLTILSLMVIVLAIFSANASICKRLCLSDQAYTKIRNGNSRKLSLSLGKAFIPPAIHCQYSVRDFCVLTHFYPLEFIFHACSHFEDVSPIGQDAGLFLQKCQRQLSLLFYTHRIINLGLFFCVKFKYSLSMRLEPLAHAYGM